MQYSSDSYKKPGMEEYYGLFCADTRKYLDDLGPRDFFKPWERKETRNPAQQAYLRSATLRPAA